MPDIFHPSAAFGTAFVSLLMRSGFRGGNLRAYLARPAAQRSGDEASIVDTAIVGPLLELLGFPRGEQRYNVQRHGDRPDFAPAVELYGTCFVVESKNTTLTLTLDLTNPESHLSQLLRYMRLTAVDLGLLTNGRVIKLYEREGGGLREILDLDLVVMLTAVAADPLQIPDAFAVQIDLLGSRCHAATFTDPTRIEHDLGLDLDTWLQWALPLGTGAGHEELLVEEVQRLLASLHTDARQLLDRHRTNAAQFARQRRYLDTAETQEAEPKLAALHEQVVGAAQSVRTSLGLVDADIAALRTILADVIAEASVYRSKKAINDAVVHVLNAARAIKYAGQPKFAKPWTDLSNVTSIQQALDAYGDTAALYLKRQAELRFAHRETRAVMEDFEAWRSLVQETALGSGDENQQANEFALQAAYVVFIRLLLIRVCEDKGLFPQRFVSDGGIKRWQEDIDRYLKFASGNPYAPLLDMAYANAQNIYAHFFTGREVFNWYRLDRTQLLMALHRLSRFNFAGVDADIVGTIYNTYVARKEKKERGQYYTPRAIVDYMLDEVGYVRGPTIIGPSQRLIDPACGSGSFLVAAAYRLVAAYRTHNPDGDPQPILKRVRDSLFGFDLNPFACYLSEVNLLIQVLDLVKIAHDRGYRAPLERFHIYNEDALASPTALFSYSRYHSRLIEESAEADQIKRRAPGTPYAGGFAFVIANPPYGAALSDEYKAVLRADWATVFYGQPDTYIFFFALALKLLANNGRLAFITPNTYLMGTNTVMLRRALLDTGRVEQIVDLPQGIWPDANVDCAIVVLTKEADVAQRQAQQPQVRMMGLRDDLGKLTRREWQEILSHDQKLWMADPKAEMNIRYDRFLQRIEEACRLSTNGTSKVQRLGDVTESSPGVDPYNTAEEGRKNDYIRGSQALPLGSIDWKKLLDTHSYVGRYELRWGTKQHYLHYGAWLARPREARFFDVPKLLVQDMRNRSLKRRLVATFDGNGFYHRKNFNSIVAKGQSDYDLKYILALFNSSLLNYWFARQYDNVHINPSYFRQIPVFPADTATQGEIIVLVDILLAEHAVLNDLRAKGYTIRVRRDGTILIDMPYDLLLRELQQHDPSFAPYTLYDAISTGVVHLPAQADKTATISSNVFVSPKHPTSLVLRHNKLWLDVPDRDLRDYLLHYLHHPRWRGMAWADVYDEVLLPVQQAHRDAFAAAVTTQRDAIQARLETIARVDAELDERVLTLYGITDAADRARIVGSAPIDEEEESDVAPTPTNSDNE